MGDAKIVDYVSKRDYNDRVVVKVRIKVPQELLNNAKDLARDVFAHTALPVDEDGITDPQSQNGQRKDAVRGQSASVQHRGSGRYREVCAAEARGAA
jgi:hypothetical protein